MNHQPKKIQIKFDGIEVIRIEDGKKSKEVMVVADKKPELIEMLWDGEVVYAIAPQSDSVLVNRLGVEPDRSIFRNLFPHN